MWPHEKLKILVPRTPLTPAYPPGTPQGSGGGQKWLKCIPTSPILKMNSEKNYDGKFRQTLKVCSQNMIFH